MYIFITSQCIHNVDDCIARFVERFVEHTTKLRTPSDKTEGKRSTADNIRRSTKTHVALSSKILERCAEIYLYKQYIFVSMVCL